MENSKLSSHNAKSELGLISLTHSQQQRLLVIHQGCCKNCHCSKRVGLSLRITNESASEMNLYTRTTTSTLFTTTIPPLAAMTPAAVRKHVIAQPGKGHHDY